LETRVAQIRKFIDERTGFVKVLFVIFFSVGVAGTALDISRDLFISLTPLALMLCLVAILAYHRSDSPGKDAVIFGAVFIAALLAETAGVNTGKLFGNYTYGDGLGLKVFNTPLIIGLNWAILTYSTAIIANKLSAPALIKITAASALMVLYDVIMEQVAPEMRMWSFEESIPIQNFVTWFILALIFHSIIRLAGLRFSNRIAKFIFIIQGIFFLILYLIFRFTS
jgi:putative membrane protein